MNTGRIENEPDAVYFGDSDKPCIGSTALRKWITDPALFYRQYVRRDLPKDDIGGNADFGHALEMVAIDGDMGAIISSGYKSYCKAHRDKALDMPPNVIMLTEPDAEAVGKMGLALRDIEAWREAVKAGRTQVTYRVDAGPCYLQARIDLDVLCDGEMPECVATYYQFDAASTKRLLLDLKKTETLYGARGFQKKALFSFHYPIQQALYTRIVADVLNVPRSELQFRFQAVSEKEYETQAYNLMDVYGSAEMLVDARIDDLLHRLQTGMWEDFEADCQTVFVPENYLQYAGE
jgi:hypothetical protein